MSDRLQQIATSLRRRWLSLVRPSGGTPAESRGAPISPSSDDAVDRPEDNRDAPAVADMDPAPLAAGPAQSVPMPAPAPAPAPAHAPAPRKRARTHSLSLGRHRITQQPDHTVPTPPLFFGPDVFGPYPRTYAPPMSFAALRAHPLAQSESPAVAVAGRHTARTLPPLPPRQQPWARSRSPTPHKPMSPTPGAPSFDPKRVRQGARSFGSLGAAARILHQGGPGEEYRVPPLPSGINTSAAISRTNTPGPGPERRSNTTASVTGFTMTGTAAGDGNATHQATLQKTDVQTDRRRGSNEDRPSDAEDMALTDVVPRSGRGAPSLPGALTQSKDGCKRSEKPMIYQVPVVDDREESPLANAPSPSLLTYPPNAAQIHVSQPLRDEEESNSSDAAGASEMQRQRSPKEREMAPQKPAASTPFLPQMRWSLLVEEDDESPTPTAPESPTTPALTTPHLPKHPRAPMPVCVPGQVTMSSYKANVVQVTLSQSHKDGGTPERVPGEVKEQEYEDERTAYPEDPNAKARGPLSGLSEKSDGPRTGSPIGGDEQLGDIKCTESDDNDKSNGETDRKVRPLPGFPSLQRVATGSFVSRPRIEGVSPPQAEPSTLPPSTPSAAVCSSPAQQDSHDNYALFALRVLSTGASSTSGRSPGQHLEIDPRSHLQSTTYQPRIADDNASPLLSGYGRDSRLGWQPEKMTWAAPPRPSATTTRGRRLRLNGMVTGRCESAAERRTISAVSGKTGSSRPQRPRRTTVQIPHARSLDMPLTSNTRSSVSPVSPGLLADLNLADNKLYTSSEIQKLKAKRESKLLDSPSERQKQHATAVLNACPSAKEYASDIGADIDISSLEAHAFAKGAFGEVRRAKMHDGREVAIKCLRLYTSAQDVNTQKLQKKLLKEIAVWSCLEHENVLPLLGLCVIGNELGMVSEYMPNGNIKEYIRRNPDVDRYRLAINVCAGLAYLHEHSNHIVHGDLKAVNVVVDADGVPKLTDFGLARVEDSTEISSSSSVGGTPRWMARELICPAAPNTVCCKPSLASDVHSLGMTIYEIFTGLFPYASRKIDAQVIAAILRRELPERVPRVLTDELWGLLLDCWRLDPRGRPTAREVLTTLQNLSRVRGDFMDDWNRSADSRTPP